VSLIVVFGVEVILSINWAHRLRQVESMTAGITSHQPEWFLVMFLVILLLGVFAYGVYCWARIVWSTKNFFLA
jgi:hypothetical protein